MEAAMVIERQLAKLAGEATALGGKSADIRIAMERVRASVKGEKIEFAEVEVEWLRGYVEGLRFKVTTREKQED